MDGTPQFSGLFTMYCFVTLYDCFRAATNPKSISRNPCCCCRTEPDVHEYYYQKFLVQGNNKN